MTVKFCFGNRRKDGTKNLKIRLKYKGYDKKIAIPGVYIDPKFWDSANNRVNAKYINAPAYNEIIVEFQEKINSVKGKLELSQIDFNTAYRMLSSSSSVDSIAEFVRTHCNHKSEQWHRNTLGTLAAVQRDLGINNLTFDDVTDENLRKLRQIHIEKNNQPDTFNYYFRHLRAVYNEALKLKVTYRDFKFSKEFIIKVNRYNKKLKTHTPEDIRDAIKKVRIKSNHRSSKKYALRDFQAIGFWLLQFCLRGLNNKDISVLTAFDSDFNYDYYLKYNQANATQESQVIQGNPNFVNHKRHKTKNMMQLWISLPPIIELIHMLKILVANNHPELAYLSIEDLRKGVDRLYEKPGYDILKIFRSDISDYKMDYKVWNNMNKHLRKLDLYSLKSARKSFNTTATHLRIHPGITRTLVGQSDSSVQNNYNNFNDERLVRDVQQSHAQVLNEFQMIELFDLWVFKLNEVFDLFNDMHIGVGSKIVYAHHVAMLHETLKRNKTTVDNIIARGVYVAGRR